MDGVSFAPGARWHGLWSTLSPVLSADAIRLWIVDNRRGLNDAASQSLFGVRAMNRKWISAIGFLLPLVAAYSSAQSDLLKNSENAKMCEVVKSLITEHKNGFESLRGDRTDTKHVTIWKAKQHVVGDACEIWQSDRKDTFYVCTRSVPSQQVADEYYVNARKRLGACLGTQWLEAEAPRETGGKKTTFSMKGMKTVIEIHAVKVDGVFRDQWTIYYFAGGAAMGM